MSGGDGGGPFGGGGGDDDGGNDPGPARRTRGDQEDSDLGQCARNERWGEPSRQPTDRLRGEPSVSAKHLWYIGLCEPLSLHALGFALVQVQEKVNWDWAQRPILYLSFLYKLCFSFRRPQRSEAPLVL
jgi:hypothetical protein